MSRRRSGCDDRGRLSAIAVLRLGLVSQDESAIQELDGRRTKTAPIESDFPALVYLLLPVDPDQPCALELVDPAVACGYGYLTGSAQPLSGHRGSVCADKDLL